MWWPWHRHQWGLWRVIQEGEIYRLPSVLERAEGVTEKRRTGVWQIQACVCEICRLRELREQSVE